MQNLKSSRKTATGCRIGPDWYEPKVSPLIFQDLVLIYASIRIVFPNSNLMNGGGMTRLSVAKIAGPYCGTHSEGEKLYAAVAPFLKRGEKIALDFDQVEIASSSFFNELFGSIIEEFGEELIEEYISYVSLKPRHQFVLDRTRYPAPA